MVHKPTASAWSESLLQMQNPRSTLELLNQNLDSNKILQWFTCTLMTEVQVKVAQSCLTICDPIDWTGHGILQARILEWVAIPFSRGSSQPRDQTRSSALQADSLPAEPQGNPKNPGVGSLSLLQGIFLTQESNWGLLHCRWILYQLSYEGSPMKSKWGAKSYKGLQSRPYQILYV